MGKSKGSLARGQGPSHQAQPLRSQTSLADLISQSLGSLGPRAPTLASHSPLLFPMDCSYPLPSFFPPQEPAAGLGAKAAGRAAPG